MWELDHKKGECWRTDAFEPWCWRRLLRVPWIARSNQSILKDINPEYSLEGLMLKLKLQYFGHLIRTAESLKKTLMMGKIEGRREGGNRGWDSWMVSSIQQTWVSNLRERVKDREAWCAVVHGVTKSRTWLSDWTTTEFVTEPSIESRFLLNSRVGLFCTLPSNFCYKQMLIIYYWFK